jgi:hypothetical protein
VDPRLAAAPVVAAFAREVAEVVELVGLYAAGSLASGDYRDGVSDLDLVAVVGSPVDAVAVRAFHERFAEEHPAGKLHCAYEPDGIYWAGRRLLRRPLGAIAQAEVLRGGVVVHGPPPVEILPPVGGHELQAAVRAELGGYWRRATRLPWLWLDDAYVDLGLLTLPRADAALADGSLITKTEALAHLPRFGVPAGLCAEIESRRRGEKTRVPALARVRRALLARRLVARGIRALAG